VNERTNIHDIPFSDRFKGDDWSAMSDRETCPISMIDAQLIADGNDPFMTLEDEAKEAPSAPSRLLPRKRPSLPWTPSRQSTPPISDAMRGWSQVH
jgi:hypothetical protein